MDDAPYIPAQGLPSPTLLPVTIERSPRSSVPLALVALAWADWAVAAETYNIRSE